MAFTKAFDCSVYQGHINFAAVKAAGYDIALIKVSGGDGPNGDYVDGLAGEHYNGARAAGLAVGTYHFAGKHDPITEATYFVQVCTPLDENQVLVLDYDTDDANAPNWVAAFVNHVHDLTGVWCIVYVNGSTFNAHNWSGVSNSGFWIAWYGRDPNQDLPVNGTYIIHQYTDAGSIPGIGGNVDLDAVYMSVEVFDKYGYHAPLPAPAPVPTPAPSPPPAPLPPTVTASTGPDSTITTAPPAPVTQTTVNTNTPNSTDSASTLPSTSTTLHATVSQSWWARLLAWLKEIL